jgi:hypothetical protein
MTISLKNERDRRGREERKGGRETMKGGKEREREGGMLSHEER